MPDLPKAYNPKEIETDIYRRWETSGYFNPDKLPNAKKRKPFVISMPPPNITGELHIGHALGLTIQDILIRYQRMRGRAALWVPGTDHAAISTQVLVERDLHKRGLNRQQLGREKFLAEVWLWKQKYGGRIVEQIKRIGASADWSREHFTMDDDLSLAVQTAFKKLYDDGLIYRGERIINWCADCQTAVSDLEVDHLETPGKLWSIKYPLADGSGYIIVATTRPETMLGDTAVAVHPDDSRYQKLIGQNVRLPITNRLIPIVADKRIDKDFGTGAVKVTPAHDPLDFDIGQTHKLPRINVIGFDGKMTAEAGAGFSGMTVEIARTAVIDRLRQDNLLEHEEDYMHAVGYCSRSKTPIEPLVSRQWFMSMRQLAKPALEVVRRGKIKIVPVRFTKVYTRWLENIRDWNISRQIWWGHRLPVWYKKSDVEKNEPTVALKKPGPQWVQEDDTLDTWFSSGLWTFSTLGWPKNTKDLARFHPTEVMETGWDILFFWVARMVMLSLYFKKEIPFKTIYLHGLILDEQGKKMSKSKGTGLDPLPVADKYGMDALRMSLIVGNAPGQDFRLYEKKIEGYRNFANKLWNISRFILAQPRPITKPQVKTLAERWIDGQRNQLISTVTKHIDNLDFSSAGEALYNFIWHDLADWYLEISKVQPNVGILYDLLETVLRLLHPFMPFITESIWGAVHPDSMLMIADWPKTHARKTSATKPFAAVMRTVIALRSFRLHSGLPSTTPLRYVPSKEYDSALLKHLTGVATEAISRLVPTSGYRDIVLGDVHWQVPVEYVEKYEAWRQKERQDVERYIGQIEKKLSNEQFVAHAPAVVVEEERQKLVEAKRRLLEL